MADSLQQAPVAEASRNGNVEEYEVLIIGAGVTGLYSLYRFRELGFSCKSFEDASGVWAGLGTGTATPAHGSTPRATPTATPSPRNCSNEWHWKELYSGQPENERYLNYVADKFDLRRHIRFNSRVESCVYDEEANRWELTMQDGHKARGQFLITAVGLLSAHYVPDFKGIHDFKGPWFHTGRWPKEGIDLAGKRVGVVGTGATAVQLITEIAREVGHLTVFQRTANYCAPLRNRPITAEEQEEIRARYPEIFEKCLETAGSFMHEFDTRGPPSAFPKRSGSSSTNRCGRSPASRSGSATSTT